MKFRTIWHMNVSSEYGVEPRIGIRREVWAESRQLAAHGERLFGPRWQTSLAKAIGVSARTMRCWKAGLVPIPPPAAIAIRSLKP